MNIHKTDIDPVVIIEQFRAEDHRGVFIKTFHETDFKLADIDFTLKESFYSVSHQHVLRGMHFHAPPYDHAKIVFCTQGSILDVALDLRNDSPTYGLSVSCVLSHENHRALYIPKGFAHGFLTLSEQATTFYFVDGVYHAASDGGVRFDSFGFNWPFRADPILSERDKQFISLSQFQSPF